MRMGLIVLISDLWFQSTSPSTSTGMWIRFDMAQKPSAWVHMSSYPLLFGHPVFMEWAIGYSYGDQPINNFQMFSTKPLCMGTLDSMGPMLMMCEWLLVLLKMAHRNNEFTQLENGRSFHSYVNVYQRVYPDMFWERAPIPSFFHLVDGFVTAFRVCFAMNFCGLTNH